MGTMSILTILLFFAYTYGLGFSITFFFKNAENFLERQFMRIGIGLGLMPVLLVFLDMLQLPLDWRLILTITAVIPVMQIFRHRQSLLKTLSPSFALTSSNLNIFIVLILFSLTLFMYASGSFRYPYLEDDDPWAHAAGIKYVAIEKNFDDPQNNLYYIRPYPPGFDGLLGILHQASPSLQWTMKFFNALIISLGIIFFYFFAKTFMQSQRKALIAAFVLAMVPSYLSHFIWAHSLVVTLLLVSLYCLSMLPADKRWCIPSMLVIAGIALTQPDQPIKFFIMYVIWFTVLWIGEKKLPKSFGASILGGYLISLMWWLPNMGSFFNKAFSYNQARSGAVMTGNLFTKFWAFLATTFPPNSGTGTRAYTFSDFFFARSVNVINNPIGIGVVISILALLSLFIAFGTFRAMPKEKKVWVSIASLWLLFTFLGINSMTFHLPIGLHAFRFWMLFALPLSLITAEGIWFLGQFLKGIGIPKIATLALLLILIFFTSGRQKYAVNTAQWGPGQMWSSFEEIQGYAWLKTLKPGTKVFSYSGDEAVIGFDAFSCAWCPEIVELRKGLLEKNISVVAPVLRSQGYKYLIMDGMAIKNNIGKYGQNETEKLFGERLAEIGSSGDFRPAYQTKGMIVFGVI